MGQSRFEMTEKQRKIIAAAGIVVFIVSVFLILWFVGLPMLRLASEPDEFRSWVDGQGAWGRLTFLGMMVLQTFVAVIPGEPFEFGAGYAFGALEGTLLCLVGTIIGSVFIFLFVRNFGIRAVEVFYPREKLRSLRFLRKTKRRDMLIFIVMLIPGTPKDLISYFVGLTDMKLSKWLLITAVGRIPSIVTSTVGGNGFGMQNYVFAVIVLLVTLGISGAGLLVYRRISAMREDKNDGSD